MIVLMDGQWSLFLSAFSCPSFFHDSDPMFHEMLLPHHHHEPAFIPTSEIMMMCLSSYQNSCCAPSVAVWLPVPPFTLFLLSFHAVDDVDKQTSGHHSYTLTAAKDGDKASVLLLRFNSISSPFLTTS